MTMSTHPLLNPCPTCGQDHTEMKLTPIQAKIIKTWRTKDGRTWWQIASVGHHRWPKQVPNDHEATGRDLCTEAALLLGEDPGEDPWN